MNENCFLWIPGVGLCLPEDDKMEACDKGSYWENQYIYS